MRPQQMPRRSKSAKHKIRTEAIPAIALLLCQRFAVRVLAPVRATRQKTYWRIRTYRVGTVHFGHLFLAKYHGKGSPNCGRSLKALRSYLRKVLV